MSVPESNKLAGIDSSARYRVTRTDGTPISSDEPCIVIRGQDILAIQVLANYLSLYENFTDATPQVIHELYEHMTRVRVWQKSHRIKLADR